MWQQWVNAILGLWTIVASWAYMPASTGRTLLIITGIVVAILGFWGAASYSGTTTSNRMHGAT